MNSRAPKKPRPPLDDEALERLALAYVGRYATTRARLKAYLARKLRERGWAGGAADPIEPLVRRFSDLRYVDDRAYAVARAVSLRRRGFGQRRVEQALRAAGIDERDSDEARESARLGAWEAALRFAERRKIGPFAAIEPDRAAREKAIAALLRAGHSFDLARKLANAHPGQIPDLDDL